MVDKYLKLPFLPHVRAEGWHFADPLCWHGATRARVAHEYLLATEAGLKAMYNYTFPFTVYHGADDTLTDPDGSQQLFERSKVGHCAGP